MTITAHIHGLPDGRIADDSTIEIEGTHYPIPEQATYGPPENRRPSRTAPHRITACLEAAGYKHATDYYGDLGDVDADGVSEFQVVKA